MYISNLPTKIRTRGPTPDGRVESEETLSQPRDLGEAFSVAVPPDGLGSVGAMQHVMPSVYVTPVTSSALLMLHVTVFGVSTTTGTAAWSAGALISKNYLFFTCKWF